MHAALGEYRQDIERLCEEFGVLRLEVFGSAARNDFRPLSSDFDFLVEFKDLGWKGSFRRYMYLKLGLEDLLGRPVDLVEMSEVRNPYLQGEINKDRQLLYAA